jgi:hypothetical protein
MAAWSAPGFVAVIVGQDGKTIVEQNEEDKRTVRVPFGTEYKLRFKNTTKARAYVRVEIDGMDVLSGKKLIMEPNCTKDLERFLQGDNLKGKKFQFVSANSAGVTDPTASENGLIRVIFEPEAVTTVTTSTHIGGGFITSPAYGGNGGSPILRGMAMGLNTGALSSFSNAAPSGTAYVCNSNAALSDASNFHIGTQAMPADLGATAAGSTSEQQFQDTNEFFHTLPPVTLDIWMKGLKVEVPRPAETVVIDGVLYKRA